MYCVSCGNLADSVIHLNVKPFWKDYDFCCSCLKLIRILLYHDLYSFSDPRLNPNPIPLDRLKYFPNKLPTDLKLRIVFGSNISQIKSLSISEIGNLLNTNIVELNIPFNGIFTQQEDKYTIFLRKSLRNSHKRWVFFHEIGHILQGEKINLFTSTLSKIYKTEKFEDLIRKDAREIIKKNRDGWSKEVYSIVYTIECIKLELDASILASMLTLSELKDPFELCFIIPKQAYKSFGPLIAGFINNIIRLMFRLMIEFDLPWVVKIRKNKSAPFILRNLMIPIFWFRCLSWLLLFCFLLITFFYFIIFFYINLLILPYAIMFSEWLKHRGRLNNFLSNIAERGKYIIVKIVPCITRFFGFAFTPIKRPLQLYHKLLITPMGEFFSKYCNEVNELDKS